MRGGKASPNTPCHSGNQTAATKLARVYFSFLYFFFFFFSPPQFFSFSFFFLFAHCFFFPFITIYFSKVGKRHETPKAVLQGFRVELKDFFSFFSLLLRLYKRLRLTPLETSWLENKLLPSDCTGQPGRKQAAKNWGKLSGGFSANLSPRLGFLLLLFSFGSFVLLCLGFPVVLNSLRCWN